MALKEQTNNPPASSSSSSSSAASASAAAASSAASAPSAASSPRSRLARAVKTQKAITERVEKIVKHVDRYEVLINKITYCLGVLCFGLFCYLLGSSPQDIPRLYCAFVIFVLPLRWIYYRIKKWHYYLLDFCYYANAISVTMLLFFPTDKRLFMLCFSFSEGPLAWALIVWRCSLVFNSIDKTISVLIHLLPGIVFFILRWWDTNMTFNSTEALPVWPVVNSIPTLWLWLFCIPLLVYCIWQALYFAVVEVLRRQRILRDPEVMTSYRELKRKAERANNIWWHLSGLLGPENRVYMYCIIQAVFTIATLAFTVLLYKCYRLHLGFEIFKISATVWNGGRFVFEVMPRQAMKKNAAAMAADNGKQANPGTVSSPADGCTLGSIKRNSGGDDSASLSNAANLESSKEEKPVVPEGERRACSEEAEETPLQPAHTTPARLEDRSRDAVTTLRLIRSVLGSYQALPRTRARTLYNRRARDELNNTRAAKVACAS